MLRVADRKAQMRHILAFSCAIADLALDDKDPFAVMPRSGCGKAAKMDAAKVHRQTERGIKRCGHGPNQIRALADNRRVSKRKSENNALQA
jgi:hypothetical protein